MRPLAAALSLATLALIAAAPAEAGTYTVHACAAAGHNWANRSWTALRAPDLVTDTDCEAPGAIIGVRADAGTTIPSGRVAGLTFTSPPGTSIVDFTLTRLLDYDNPVASGTRPLFTLYQLGPTVFAGAGEFDDATRNRLNAQRLWYGYPANEVHIPRQTVTLRSFASLAGYRGDAQTLLLRIGCFARNASPCSVGSGGRDYHIFHGTQVTINDTVPPSSVTVEAKGLLEGGQRHGSDPVTVSGADNTGIKRVEIVDVTGAPRVVGSESYDAGPTLDPGDVRTDAGATCSFRLVHACPNLGGETVRPTSLAAGKRRLLVRLVDTGENAVERGPFAVDVITPSDRGPLNGSGATESAKIVLRFSKGRRSRRTVGYGTKVGLRGRLLNSAGQPIAGAELRLLTRDLRRNAPAVDRKGIKTIRDGSFRLSTRALASRQLQVAWRSHVNDERFATSSYLTLRARAAGTLTARPRSVRVGRSVTLRGRLKGVRRGSVPIVLQGRVRGARRFSTFADATTSSRGTFRASYRFRSAASRGRTFEFRARIRRAPGFPYETGYSRRVAVRVR